MKVPLIITTFILTALVARSQDNVLSLQGRWTVSLDSTDRGIENNWQTGKYSSGASIQLPGTLDEAGLGRRSVVTPKLQRPVVDQLTRKQSYIGAAWYSREVTIPESWKNQQIILFLERVIWKTEVWVDGVKYEGHNESLVAPHVFNLSRLLTPGKHIIVIRVDNRKQHDISLDVRNFAHAYTEGTQVIWNGILGKIELRQRNNIYVESLQVFASRDSSQIRFNINISNSTGVKSDGSVDIRVPGLLDLATSRVVLTGGNQKISVVYKVGADRIYDWDEFNPKRYSAEVTLRTRQKGKEARTGLVELFAFRKISVHNSLLSINNRRLYLRGTLECAIFPLTGHPPMDVEAWEKIFTAAKSYGLNHLRFHSWCPPDAAFEAADKMGFYLQIELPLWSTTVGRSESVNLFLRSEADRIIQYYGNHPSFCFWSIGNELEGDFGWLNDLVAELKKKDSRHRYATTTFTFQNGHGKWPEPQDEYFVTQYTKKGWVRGQGVFDAERPNFAKDYSASIDSIPVPIISHEIGQYSIYPNLAEIPKYTGILDPLNFKAVEADLRRKDMLQLAPAFTRATGRFAVQLYKEEIERALRTEGFSGFQLLDLHDFPGQGTALVGVLDAFWESKGFVTDEEFRTFCASVVPLIRYPKAVYTNNETFRASVEIANFSASELKNQEVRWKIIASDGAVLASGSFPQQTFKVGNGLNAGSITADLSKIAKADKLQIEVEVASNKNQWNIWVYPETIATKPSSVIVTRSYDEAEKQLQLGKNVLLIPELKSIKGIEGKFVPVFWSPVHFPNQPGTMGILVDPAHKVFQSFPTDSHSTWQWWDINKNSVVVEGKEPVIRVIDNFFKNRELGILYEFKSGNGKLMVCTADLLSEQETRPVARQLYHSILNYMNSSAFVPRNELDVEFVNSIRLQM